MRFLSILLTLLIFSFSASKPLLAVNDYRFRTLSPKGGFYYDGVKSVLPDKKGFIWVMLDNDLQRFDGYEYKRYFPFFKQLNASANWVFNGMAMDTSGSIYIATNNGLYKYSQSGILKIISNNTYSKVFIDQQNNIIVAYNGQLHRYDEKTNELKGLLSDGNIIEIISSFQSNSKGVFMATPDGKIYHYHYKNPHSVSLFYTSPPNFRISDMYYKDAILWILTTDHGILKLNSSSGRMEDRFDFPYEHGGQRNVARKIYIDKKNNVWIGTQRALFILDPVTRKRYAYFFSQSSDYSLPNNSIWNITEDAQQNIWIGTYAGGLCYVNPEENIRFKTYTPDKGSLNHNLVSSFAENRRFLWIGTEGGGLNRMDKTNGSFTYLEHSENNNSLSYNNIKSLALDRNENLWIAMFRGGLNCYHTKTGTITRLKHTEGNNTGLLSNNLRKIVLESDSGLWIAYQLEKLTISFFSFKTQSFTHIEFGQGDELVDDLIIYDIRKGNNGLLWILTRKQLYCLNAKTHAVEKIKSPQGASYLNAQTLCLDSNDNVWIGTIGNGLVKYDPKKKKSFSFEDILKYNTSTIYSICPDDENYLWLGTDNGLFRYSIQAQSYLRFDENDGLQGTMYYPSAAMKSSSGELYFGGSNGFSIINPRNIKINTIKPKVIISDFFIDNVSVDKGIAFNSAFNEITLNHNQSNFGFKFSSDNYLIPAKNRFKYRLRGYDNRWITTDASNRTVFYSKIPTGIYYFEILAANNDGVWGDQMTVIKIKRLPPFWFSWQGYLLQFFIFSGIMILILRYFREKKKLKLQLYLDQMEKLKKEEIHQSQIRFFTNVSHDFRTPLSLILGALDNLKQEGLKEYYYRILNNNAQRLLNLVNELMDFRTIENKKMRLQVEPIDINQLIQRISIDFEVLAEKRNIEFQAIHDPEILPLLYADANIVEKIVMNLLNNAFKYTKNGGNIRIESFAKADHFSSRYKNSFTVSEGGNLNNHFLIVIRDSGIGISKESIESVFDRYYMVTSENLDAHLGTGIGLALAKSLVLLHKGYITIYSEREKGTDIVIGLPVDSSAYEPADFSQRKENADENADSFITDQEKKREEPFFRERKCILLVEDNTDLRTLIARFLSPHYEIKEAINGMDGSLMVEKTDIDLIVSDIMMPVKDGITFCREIKNDVNTSHIPFLLLTAKTGLENKLEGAGSGADEYFEKPIDFNLLLLTIQNIFKRQQNLREYYAKTYYVESAELSANEQDNRFLKKLTEMIDSEMDQPTINVNSIASELSMSRSKLYSKIKTLTGKSIVEFILNYRLKKAARLIIEQDLSLLQVMEMVGIKSQSYFTNAFKKEFGDTPAAFATKNRKKNTSNPSKPASTNDMKK